MVLALALKSGISYLDFLSMPFSLLMPTIEQIYKLSQGKNKETKKIDLKDCKRISREEKQKWLEQKRKEWGDKNG